MNNCETCRYDSLSHMLDMLSYTLGDLGCDFEISECTDIELLEIADRKIRMLYTMCVKAGVNENILRVSMNG